MMIYGKPGFNVQKTGTYICTYCGPDGSAVEMLKDMAKSRGKHFAPKEDRHKRPSYRFFQEKVKHWGAISIYNADPENPQVKDKLPTIRKELENLRSNGLSKI